MRGEPIELEVGTEGTGLQRSFASACVLMVPGSDQDLFCNSCKWLRRRSCFSVVPGSFGLSALAVK